MLISSDTAVNRVLKEIILDSTMQRESVFLIES